MILPGDLPATLQGRERAGRRIRTGKAGRERHQLEDSPAKYEAKIERRNQVVQASQQCDPDAGRRRLQPRIVRHTLTGLVELRLDRRVLILLC